MKKSRIIALLLAVITLTAVFTGCGEDNAPESDSGTQPSVFQPASGTTSGSAQTSTPATAPEPHSKGLEFELNEDGTAYTVVGIGSCQDTDVIIPSVHKGLPVKGIGENAFKYCISLTGVTIPEGVTVIDDYAFYGCESLTSITIPGSVTDIGEWAFTYCSSLTSITIPEGVTVIDEYTFASCTSLESITIPNGVTVIGEGAFGSCALTSVTIPEGVTDIGTYAFNTCTSLESITIPDSVTVIGSNAFLDCTSLTSIHYGGTVAQWKEAVGYQRIVCVVTCIDGTVTLN